MKLTKKQIERIQTLHKKNKKLSYKDIANKIKCSEFQVYYWLKKIV